MNSQGCAVLKRISYKGTGIGVATLSILAGKDKDKPRYLDAMLNFNVAKCQGLQNVEFELKKKQANDVKATLLVSFESLNLYGYISNGKFVNYSGLLTSLSVRTKAETKDKS